MHYFRIRGVQIAFGKIIPANVLAVFKVCFSIVVNVICVVVYHVRGRVIVVVVF